MIIDKHLFEQIRGAMPIPSVDLVVVNNGGEVLLARRTMEPAYGEWWFPGGRVHYLETRLSAAVRKLREECGVESTQWGELGTFDVILTGLRDGKKAHGITTVFVARVGTNTVLRLMRNIQRRLGDHLSIGCASSSTPLSNEL